GASILATGGGGDPEIGLLWAYNVVEQGNDIVMVDPKAMPDEALAHADAVAIGDAETTLPHILADWRAGRLKGTYNWRDYPTAPIATPRKDLLNPADYLVFNPIQTTRGCPHSCSFCTSPAIFGRKFRLRRIADIVEEIRQARDQYHSWCFIFADDDFAGNHRWALELCHALEPLKIKWASQCDILISDNERLLSAMARSGCIGLILGLESTNQAALDEAGKGYARADRYTTQIRKIQSYGINVWGSFIFGFDHDDWRSCMAACRFAQRMNLCMSCYPILTPYPGTAIFEQFRRQGRLISTDWQRYNGASVVYWPARMSPAELRHAQLAAFAEFYSPRSALRRLRVWPLRWRSWLANLACYRGLSYYYARKARAMPRFADFADRTSRAWRYLRDEPSQEPDRLEAAQGIEALAARALRDTDGFVAASALLQSFNSRRHDLRCTRR
ncbi:MAG: DUF917 family protein, partial [Phycisphaerae bacterium]